MSIKLNDGTVLRNLEEQVQFLTNYHDVNQGLAQWGIRVVGTVASSSELPNPYDGEYGDTYAVGTKAPYFFYIWTRAAMAGGPAYWFPFGEISIVGPKGPKGDKGDKGDTGKSSRWYAGSTPPVAGGTGDLWLELSYYGGGNVWQWNGQIWQDIGSIRGPQGIQGIQGPKGDTGAQGPQGIQGERGDVGGLVNIKGILTNQNQLPLPSSLNNLTDAYLVGTVEPYNLYIQIGNTPADATWVDVGPLNVATLVTVNGQYQNTWDANTKVDRVIKTSPHLYGETSTGPSMYMLDSKSGAWTVAQRGANGVLTVGTPTASNHAATKGYVDGLVLTYISNSSTSGYFYIGLDNGQMGRAYFTMPNTILDQFNDGNIELYQVFLNMGINSYGCGIPCFTEENIGSLWYDGEDIVWAASLDQIQIVDHIEFIPF